MCALSNNKELSSVPHGERRGGAHIRLSTALAREDNTWGDLHAPWLVYPGVMGIGVVTGGGSGGRGEMYMCCEDHVVEK